MISGIKKIEKVLEGVATGSLSSSPLGMIDGYSGVILLLAHYYVVTKREVYADNLFILVNHCIRYINANQAKLDVTLGYGLSGFCHALHIAKELDKGSFAELGELQDELDPLIITFMQSQIPLFGTLDLFYGINGILNYAAERPGMSPLVEIYGARFNDSTLFDGYWSREVEGMEYLNLGVPHGIVGSILLHVKLLKNGHNVGEQGMNKAINLLLSQNKDISDYSKSYFPARVVKNDPFRYFISPLAWCYGDLPAAIALLEYGKVTGQSTYEELANEVLKYTLSLREASADGSLCHGAVSVASLYGKAFELTSDKDFRSAEHYWMKKAKEELSQETLVDGLLKEQSLFNGYPGVFLSLLSDEHTFRKSWKSLIYL